MMLLQQILLEKIITNKIMATYETFKNYVLFHQDFVFKISLYFIFNEENFIKTSGDDPKFMMTYEKFKKYLIKLRQYAKDSCGVVCQSDKKCSGHKTLELMQQYDDFIFDSVERCKCFYKYVKFIKTKSDGAAMFGFIPVPINEIDLGWHTWSQRMRYLLI